MLIIGSITSILSFKFQTKKEKVEHHKNKAKQRKKKLRKKTLKELFMPHKFYLFKAPRIMMWIIKAGAKKRFDFERLDDLGRSNETMNENYVSNVLKRLIWVVWIVYICHAKMHGPVAKPRLKCHLISMFTTYNAA